MLTILILQSLVMGVIFLIAGYILTSLLDDLVGWLMEKRYDELRNRYSLTDKVPSTSRCNPLTNRGGKGVKENTRRHTSPRLLESKDGTN